MTVMGDAITRAGIDVNEARFRVDLARYLNKGGTIERAKALLNAVEVEMLGAGQAANSTQARPPVPVAQHANAEMPRTGQSATADGASLSVLAARQRNGDEAGHCSFADQASEDVPASLPNESSAEGQSAHADEAHHVVPSGAGQDRERGAKLPVPEGRLPRSPAREPMTKERLAATLQVRQQAARSIWSRSIGGSLTLGTATRYDLRQLARKAHITEATAVRLITEIAWPDDDKTTLQHVASEEQVRAILEAGARSMMALEGA